MPFGQAELEEIRAECFADDMAIPAGMAAWDRSRVARYFESGGESEDPKASAQTAAHVAALKQSWAPATTQPPPVPPAHLPTPPFTSGGTALAASMSYEVVHTFVRVRTAPKLDAQELGLQKKGAILSIDAVLGDWVRLEEEPTAATGSAVSGNRTLAQGWMLTDGSSLPSGMKLGTLLKPHILELPEGTEWQVTRPGGCLGYASPGGAAFGVGTQLDECAEGKRVQATAECGLWARVKTADGSAHWVEMDAFFAG